VRLCSPTLPLAPSPTLFVLLAVIVVANAGCDSGPSGPKRGKPAGTVTLNGKPVAKGTIRFMALDPSGMNAASPINDGQYSVPEDQGLTKGKYQVQFSVPSNTTRKVPNDDVPGQFMEVAPETLPAKYHSASTITLEYDPDQPKPHDYQLTTP
jgi:hypothetical protein